MQTNSLGWTDLCLTRLGLGAWAIGGDWKFGWGPQDERESIRTIQRSIDLGFNWIDTAPAYGHGASEQAIAKALKGRRDGVILATKCGLVWEPGDWGVRNRLTARSVRHEAEDSLRRLETDVIDLYQIHWPNPDPQIEEAWGEIARLVQEGKVRYAGVSNFSVSQIERVRVIHPVASLQPPYNMLQRGIERDLLPYCAQHNIGVIVYSPMYSGLLTGKYNQESVSQLAHTDWRRGDAEFQEPRLSRNLTLVEGLRRIAGSYGVSLPILALAWTLRRPEVTAAIAGARRPEQVEALVPAGDWRLPPEASAEIESLLAR